MFMITDAKQTTILELKKTKMRGYSRTIKEMDFTEQLLSKMILDRASSTN